MAAERDEHRGAGMTADRRNRRSRRAKTWPPKGLAAVRQIYAELAARPIQRDCLQRTECCQFRLTGATPFLTKGEALLAARAWRATGRARLPEPEDGSCPMLQPGTGKCLIYADRPFGCRTHFCAAAGGPYRREEVRDLIQRLEAIGARLGEAEARPIGSAVAEALTFLVARLRAKSDSRGERIRSQKYGSATFRQTLPRHRLHRRHRPGHRKIPGCRRGARHREWPHGGPRKGGDPNASSPPIPPRSWRGWRSTFPRRGGGRNHAALSAIWRSS